MTDEKFDKKHYDTTTFIGNNKLCVNKLTSSDWSHITMRTNDEVNGTITLKSKEIAEALHFMLGQMLGKS